MKVSKFRTLKKVLLNIVAVLLVVSYTGNIIANANAAMVNDVLGTSFTKLELKPGAVDEGFKRYYESEYDSVKALKEAGEKLVREVEGEGIVLLKNEGNLLPLATGSDVSLIGLTAIDPVYGGTGSGAVDADGAPTFETVLAGEYNLVNQQLLNYYKNDADKRSTNDMAEPKWSKVKREAKYDDENGEEVVGIGGHVFFIVGRVGGEGDDMTRQDIEGAWEIENGTDYLSLSKNERDTLAGLAEWKEEGVIESITVIINSANPISVGFINEEEYGVDAALWVGSVGQTGLWAVADVIAGRTNPSGSLPDTWWVDNQLNPVQNNFDAYTYENADAYALGSTSYGRYVVYQEGIYMGYKYTETRYEDVVLGTPNVGDYKYNEVVGYPFGYGQSYTTFEFSDMTVNKETRTTKEYLTMVTEAEAAAAADRTETVYTVSVKVTNTGDKAGKKTVQVYAQKPYTEYDKQNQIEKAAVELVGYGKTQILEPGASETVTVTVPEYFLTSYDALGTGVYILSEGEHYLTVADNSHEAVNNILNVKGKTTADGMTSEGNAALVYSFEGTFDADTYAKAYGTGAEVKSMFDEADLNRYVGKGENSVKYYSRSDWAGTVTQGPVKITMTEQMAADLVLDDADLTALVAVDETETALPTMGVSNNLRLIDMMDAAYDDPKWDTFMDQLTYDELAKITANGLRMTVGIDSIEKPQTLDHNGPSGVTQPYSIGKNTQGYASVNNDPDQNLKGTCFPCNGIVAATFNDELVERVGELIGEDCMWAGYAGLYGTGLNIHRSPYAGRVFEYYSEDGILTGLIDTAETIGIQSKGVYVYNKHFVLNDQEKNRAGISTWINEQALREIYLRAFELPIVNADAKCVMTAFNRLGVIWAGAYRELLTDWLRGEAGMGGFAVTDMYDGSYMVKAHEIAAGNDIPDNYVGDDLKELANYGPDASKQNNVLINRMRESSKRVLYTVLHSRGMDGISDSTILVKVTPWWQTALTAAQWGSLALTVLFGALLAVDILKEKYGKKA